MNLKYILERMPLVIVFGAYAVGIVLARMELANQLLWIVLALVGLALGRLPWRFNGIGTLLLAILALGGLNYSHNVHFGANHLSNYHFTGEPDSIRAMVEESGINERCEQKVRLTDIRISHGSVAWYAYEGKMLLTMRSVTPRLRYGQEIKFMACLREPARRRNPGEFDYRRYLFNHHIFAVASLDSNQAPVILGQKGFWLRRWASSTKSGIETLLDKGTSGETNAILKALLVGVKGEISDETIQQFVDSGVIHVLAVSGLHVGYVTLVILVLLGLFRVPRRPKTVIAILGLAFYALMVDLRPSVNRAVIMAALLLISQAWELRVNTYNTVAAAAFLQTLFNPFQLFDMGFQLSFLAVLSIVFIYKRLDEMLLAVIKDFFIKRPILRSVYQLFFVSFSALMGTLPITIYYFQRIPLIALLANLIVVPLVGVICALGFAEVILGAIWNEFNLTYGAAQMILVEGLQRFIRFVNQVPYSSFEVAAISISQVWLCYVILSMVLFLNKRRVRWAFVCFLLVGLNYWVWLPIFNPPALRVTFLDVGQGDAIFIQWPNGENMLVDTGERTFRRDYGKLVIAPFLKRQGIKQIDLLVLTHPHGDHIGGAPYLLRHFKVSAIWQSPIEGKSQLTNEIAHLIDSLNIQESKIYAGDYLAVGQEGVVYALHPSATFCAYNYPGYNDYSIVLKCVYHNQTILLCGDAEATAEEYLEGWGDFLQARVIKVPHHGSATSSTASFIAIVKPELAVVSVGEKNKFDHPSSETLSRFQAIKAQIHRTDQQGALALRVTSDGWKIQPWH